MKPDDPTDTRTRYCKFCRARTTVKDYTTFMRFHTRSLTDGRMCRRAQAFIAAQELAATITITKVLTKCGCGATYETECELDDTAPVITHIAALKRRHWAVTTGLGPHVTSAICPTCARTEKRG